MGPNTNNPIVPDGGAVGHTTGFTNNLWNNQYTLEEGIFHTHPAGDEILRQRTADFSIVRRLQTKVCVFAIHDEPNRLTFLSPASDNIQ